MIQPIASPKPIRAPSWLRRAWRRWAAPPTLRLQYSILLAADRASEWPPVRVFLRAGSFVWTLLHDAALSVHGGCSDWLSEVLRHSAFVAIFNFWRTAWIEARRVMSTIGQALTIILLVSVASSGPSSVLTALSLIAQLSFVHLVLMFYLLQRQDGAASGLQLRRARLRAPSEAASAAVSSLPRNNMAVSSSARMQLHRPAAPSGIAGFFAKLFQRGAASGSEAAAASSSSSSPRSPALGPSSSHVPRSSEQRLPLVLPPAMGSALQHAISMHMGVRHHTPATPSIQHPSPFAQQHPSYLRESLGQALASAAHDDDADARHDQVSPAPAAESSMQRKHQER